MEQHSANLQAESPQTLRSESLQIGDDNATPSPYERSKYFQSGLGDPSSHKGKDLASNSTRDIMPNSNATWPQRQIEVIDLTLESDGDGDGNGNGNVMKSKKTTDNNDEKKRNEPPQSADNGESPNTAKAISHIPVALKHYGNLHLHPTLRISHNLIQPQPLKNLKIHVNNDLEASVNRPAGSSQFTGITERLWDRSDIIQPIDRRKAKPRNTYNS
jgi:hypothetical protein